jgi:hypothetical protein
MQRLTNIPDIRIESAHSRAICEEVGYGLRRRLKDIPADNPQLHRLMDQLCLQDVDGAPSIVPSSNGAGD